jgi:hypothetical protein
LRKSQTEGSYVGTRNGIAGSVTDVVLNTMTANDKIDNKIWIGNVALPAIIAIVKKAYMTTQ